MLAIMQRIELRKISARGTATKAPRPDKNGSTSFVIRQSFARGSACVKCTGSIPQRNRRSSESHYYYSRVTFERTAVDEPCDPSADYKETVPGSHSQFALYMQAGASKMRIVLVRFREVSQKYPIVRGMASYAVIWPTASLIQQKLIGKDELSYAQALRFSIYGGFFVAPTLYCWLKCASYFWPKSDLRSAITKALVEQVTYSPAAMCSFFFGISLLELKPVSECLDQVKEKFWPTYKIGVCVWPVLQTINFFLVPEHNRVVYVSVCSLMWTSFLAYMKSLEAQKKEMQLQIGAVMQNAENVPSKTTKEPAAEATIKTKERVPVIR